jgi:hypothetical protein
MKKIIVLLTAAIFVLHLQAQSLLDTDVPAAVKTEFSNAHPTAMTVSWKHAATDYEVEYMQHAAVNYAVYTADGKLVETRYKITAFDLPSTVYAYIKEHYPNAPSKEYLRITDATGIVTFGVKVNGQEVFFDKKGTYLNTINFVL